MHHSRVWVVAGVATLLLLAERGAALLARVGGCPDILVSLGARHYRRVADWHHAALASASLLADHDGGDVDSRTLEVQGLDHGASRDGPTCDREYLVCCHGFPPLVGVRYFSSEPFRSPEERFFEPAPQVRKPIKKRLRDFITSKKLSMRSPNRLIWLVATHYTEHKRTSAYILIDKINGVGSNSLS